jgi:hypothetical protein
MFINILKEYITFFFIVEEYPKQVPNTMLTAYPEDGGSAFLRNIGKHLPDCMV